MIEHEIEYNAEQSSSPTEAERMLNVGVPIELKKLGKVRVKELTLEDTIKLAKELAIVFSSIDVELMKENRGLEWIMALVDDPITQEAIRSIAAASTDRNANEFINMGIGDWLKLLVALKAVVDWEEMKDLFFQIVPSDIVKNWRNIRETKGT